MTYLLMALSGVVILSLLVYSMNGRLDSCGDTYSSSIFNIPALVLISIFLIWVDFAYLYYFGSSSLDRLTLSFSDEQIQIGILYISAVSILFSIVCVLLNKNNKHGNHPSEPTISYHIYDRTTAKLVFYTVYISAFTLVVISLSRHGFDAQGIRYAKAFEFKDSLSFAVLFSLFPAFSLYLFKSRPSISFATISFVLVAVLMILTGSRTRVLFPALAFASYVIYAGFKLRDWYLPAIVAGLFVLSWVFFLGLRLVGDEERISEFTARAGGEGVAAIFLSQEFSTSETILLTLDQDMYGLERGAGSSFAGFVGYFIPRSIWTAKPLNASADFTSQIDAEGWYESNRALVVGGFGDLILEYGQLGSIFVWAFLATVLMFLRRLVARRREYYWYPALLFAVFTFVRVDIQSIGTVFWPFLGIYLFYQLLRPWVGVLRSGTFVAKRRASADRMPARETRKLRRT